MGLIFEKMCQDYLLHYAEELPIELGDVGQWWGTDLKTHTQLQIDIVGTSVDKDAFIVGSCKYKNEKVGIDEYKLLKEYAEIFAKERKTYLYIFSKSGFTSSLREIGNKGEVRLITLDDIYR